MQKQSRPDVLCLRSHLLVAGRTLNTENIGLELAGVEVTDRGYIKVNERLETTAPDVWAIGEVAGSPQFTHVSVDDFRVVHDNLTGGKRVTTGRQIPFCLFTDPELARVGLTERKLKQNVSHTACSRSRWRGLRARTLSETRGFLKALVELNSDRLLGFTAFAVDGGEIMASVQTAMMAACPTLRSAMASGPTHSCRGAYPAILVDAFGVGNQAIGDPLISSHEVLSVKGIKK